MSNDTLQDLFDELRKQRQYVKVADNRLTAERQALQDIEDDIMERMEQEGFESVKVDGIRYASKQTIYAQITDKEALLNWLENSPESDEDLLTFKPSAARLNEIVRSKLDNQEEMPPGVTFRPKRYISITSD